MVQDPQSRTHVTQTIKDPQLGCMHTNSHNQQKYYQKSNEQKKKQAGFIKT